MFGYGSDKKEDVEVIEDTRYIETNNRVHVIYQDGEILGYVSDQPSAVDLIQTIAEQKLIELEKNSDSVVWTDHRPHGGLGTPITSIRFYTNVSAWWSPFSWVEELGNVYFTNISQLEINPKN